MTIGIPEVIFSYDEWPEWIRVDVVIWLELEPMLGFAKGIKLLVGANTLIDHTFLESNMKLEVLVNLL